MKQTISLIAMIVAMPAFAEDTRQLDAHEHGVGSLNIAFDGTDVAMEFIAPGADIVGFEYAAESDADLAAIDAASTALSAPLDLFVMPDAAGCTVVSVEAGLEGEEHHDDHDEHGHDDHDDEDHADHAKDDHDDHAHDDHGDEGHADHAEESGHTEFHAEYALTCADPDALTQITFAYFDAFPNAQEVEVQIVSASGAQAHEVPRDTPVLTLGR